MADIFIKPQEGPQTRFLSSVADIAIYGGAAGGGKSFALLLEPLRHVDNPQFGAVIFRRTLADIKKQGSLWDTSLPVYGSIKGHPRQDNLSWRFPSGAKITFAGLEHDASVLDWQGSQLCFIGFDELTHYSRSQFFYMLSRNRSTCGVRPYVRCSTNPDSESWVAQLISWWIDTETGYPLSERSGKVRWFVRISDELVWADSREELIASYAGCEPKSLTFIPARLEDNAILMAKDPGYRANLLALPLVERERLLGGNWKIRPSAGMYFQRRWFGAPITRGPDKAQRVRSWDLAASIQEGSSDPSWTVGVLMAKDSDGAYYIEDVNRFRGSAHEVERAIRSCASVDGRRVQIRLPQDPGQAGKAQSEYLIRTLAGFNVGAERETGSKEVRAMPLAAQCEAGNVRIVQGAWNDQFLSELESFPMGAHDDQVDAAGGAFERLAGARRPMVISDELLMRSARGF